MKAPKSLVETSRRCRESRETGGSTGGAAVAYCGGHQRSKLSGDVGRVGSVGDF